MRDWLERRSGVMAQVLATFTVALSLSLLAWRYRVETPFNLAWFLGWPILLATLYNRQMVLRVRMSVILVLISFLGVGFAAFLIGYP